MSIISKISINSTNLLQNPLMLGMKLIYIILKRLILSQFRFLARFLRDVVSSFLSLLYIHVLKVASFQKVRFFTVDCNWRENLNFKLRIVFWNNFFWRFGDRKNTSHFLKKSHLYLLSLCFPSASMFGFSRLNHIKGLL